MYPFDFKKNTSCIDGEQIINNNWQLVENYDGTVSLYDANLTNISSTIETKPCCEVLGYTFDLDEQKCRWGTASTECNFYTKDPYKIVLNPNINEGVLFTYEDNEICTLDISFDYLFKFECDDVLDAVFGQNGGQKLIELKDKISLLTQELTNLNSQITYLTNQVQTEISYDIPYVVQCNSTLSNEYEANVYDNLGDKKKIEAEQETAFDKENLKSGFYKDPTAPNAFAIPSLIENYCLTNDGLSAWENILGTNTYNLWIASNGTDTTLYDCSEVNQLLVQNQTNNNLIRTTCDYTIFDKNISINKINKLNVKITNAQTKSQEIQNNISILQDELDALDGGNCPLLSVFEDFNTEFTLEVLNTQTNKLETVYSEQLLNIGFGNLYNYITSTSGQTGILISGFTGCDFSASTNNTSAQCLELSDLLFNDIYTNRYLGDTDNVPPTSDEEYQTLTDTINCWYQKACWLQFSTTITGDTINQIRDKSINISIKINNSCSDFSILLDRIKINKKCVKVENLERFISEPPKFEIERVIDNKKSWVSKEETEKRFFELKYRNTEYQSNHHKLIINTKEVDLNLSPARAVENDVWCFVEDNNCILEGCNETYTPFSCPVSYTALTSFTACEKIETTGSTSSVTEYTASTPNNFTAQNHSLDRGTIFVEDITTLDWPIFWTGTPQNTWVGPYYNVDYLTDSSGKYLTHTGFGKKYSSSGALIWSSPDAFSGEFSEYGNSSSDLFNLKFNPNILWGGTSLDVSGSVFTNLTNTTVSGRLYNGAIWTNSGSTPDDEWIGFSYTFDLDETKVYRIGFAADQKVRIKVNGSYLINSDISPVHPINSVDGVFNSTNIYSNSPDSRFKQVYLVAGITLYEGKNIIEAEGFSSGFSSGFVCEVYNASEEHLMNMRYETELSGVTVFSTRSQIGNVYTIGENSGYSCPTGYGLDTSIAAPYQCLSIDRIGRQEIQDICCCEGFPIVIEELDGEYVELPLTASTTTANVVSDLTTLLTNPDNFQKLDTLKCGQAYLLSTTAATPDDYVITTENDGTIGLYLLSGTTYYNVSNQSTSGLCGRIDVGFQKYFNATNQGILKFPTTKWDPNTERCAYNKAGDDGCLNLDDLLTTELSEIDTVQEFSTVISSEFIDAKNRQTISSYPTLRLFYDRYNNHALEYCDVNSSSYDYFDMDNFGKTVGDYWIELIEQVVPATTIWNSTYTYRNTIFDQQKFKYKSNNIYLCEDPSAKFPFSAVSTNNSVSVETFKLGPNQILSGTTITTTEEPLTLRSCTAVWTMQHTCNPTFLGTVKVTGKDQVTDSVNDVIIAP